MAPRLLLAAALTAVLAGPGLAALEPEPVAPTVARLVTRLLEESHYAGRPVDDSVSRQMLRNYIEYFDYNHMVLDKADIDEFEALYDAALDDRLKAGDVSPAYVIFDRVKTRLEERVALARTVLASTFTFDTDETFSLDRAKAPWPATKEESADLWRLRLKYEVLQERLNGASPADQVKTVKGRYEQLLRTFGEYDSSGVLDSYLSALTRVFDPHSEYLAEAQAENFNIAMRLSLVGIGAVLRSEEGYPKIVSLVPGGPADMGRRLKPNDRIEAVAQGDAPFVEVMGMNLDKVVQKIRGEKGTTVRLRVIPADALDPATRVVVAIVRDEIKLTEQEAKAKVITAPIADGKTSRLGLIELPSFYADLERGRAGKSTTRDVEKLLARLRKEGIDGLILDLRRNGGGSLNEAVALTGLFIPYGPVVQVKDARGEVQVLDDSDPGTAYSGPMLVLTSRASASASEILAGALQDYGRAIVVGEKSTFGKGTVQAMLKLSQYLPLGLRAAKPGSVKLTTAKFYRVSGGSTQNRGVIPDIRLPSVSDEGDFAESSQKNALPYDEIVAARFRRTGEVAGSLRALEAASAARVATAREFDYVREDIELYRKQAKHKSVSLNEKKRLEEKKAQEDRAGARKKERAARNPKPFEEGPEITIAELEGRPVPPKAPPVEEKGKPAKPGGAGEDEAGYEKAPPAPDLFLGEGVAILTDMAAGLVTQAQPQSVAQPR